MHEALAAQTGPQAAHARMQVYIGVSIQFRKRLTQNRLTWPDSQGHDNGLQQQYNISIVTSRVFCVRKPRTSSVLPSMVGLMPFSASATSFSTTARSPKCTNPNSRLGLSGRAGGITTLITCLVQRRHAACQRKAAKDEVQPACSPACEG